MTYTKAEIREKIENDQAWLERGVLAIYRQQTQTEQAVGQTYNHNNRGFSSADAGYLSYVASWLQSGKRLSGRHLGKTRQRMRKYAGQLAKIANGEIQDIVTTRKQEEAGTWS